MTDMEPVNNALEQKTGRRRVLKAAGATGVSLLSAGCLGGALGGPGNDQNTGTETGSPAPTEKPDTETNTETSPEPDHGRINFVPKDASGDEDWLANPLFSEDKFNGDIKYEVNIPEAESHRSIVKDQASEFTEVDEFVQNFSKHLWRKQFRETWEEKAGTETPPVDVELLKNTEEPLDKRIVESGIHEFILNYQAKNNGWEISSTYRDALAAMLQEVVDPDRNNVIISPHEVPAIEEGGYHGMDWAIQNPAGHRGNYDSEEAYRKAKQQEKSFLVDTAYPQPEKHSDGSENISESDYTEEGTWEWEQFAHFALYDGQPVNRGEAGATAEKMKNRVQQAFLNFTMNQNHSRSFDVDMDEDFALELAKYAMNPQESELTGQFINEYSAAIRDMDESGRFEGHTVELGLDYVEV